MATFKPRKPLTVVITLEGLSAASLGCYGCSWNETPAFDQLAALGVVWDRWTATTVVQNQLIEDYIRQSSTMLGSRSAIITDDDKLRVDDVFGSATRIGSSPVEANPNASDDDLSNTAFGRVFAAAADHLSAETELVWIHSAALREIWDAPPEEVLEAEEQAPSDEVELIPVSENEERPILQLPATHSPPNHKLQSDDHPDLVFAWMQRYASNIRVLDDLVGWAKDAWSRRKPEFLIAGTSGFSLGENGWIGHGVGPLRSLDTRLPLFVSRGGPLRVGELTSSANFGDVLGRLISRGKTMDPESWASTTEPTRAIETLSDRAERAVTTRDWFYVRDANEMVDGLSTDERLFLKPDDLHDVNDVSRLRRDVLDSFQD